MTLLLDIPVPRPSPLHRLDPRWRLAALLFGGCSMIAMQSLLPMLAALAAALLLVLLARLPLRWVALRLGAALLLPAFFVLWLPFTAQAGEIFSPGGVAISVTGLVRAIRWWRRRRRLSHSCLWCWRLHHCKILSRRRSRCGSRVGSCIWH